LKAARKDARDAGTLPKKLEAQQRVRNLEYRRDQAWKAADLAKAEIDKQKDALLETIAERLQQETKSVELFTIRWTVA
jgi:uncharacterized FlgJ-related protein